MTLTLLPLLILIIVLLLSAAAFAPGVRPGDPRVAEIRSRILRWRFASVGVAFVAAVAAAVFAIRSDRVIAAFVMLPFVFVIVWLLVIAVVESRVYRPVESGVASAGLSRRTWRDYVPRALASSAGVGVLGVLGIIGVAYANTVGDSLWIECTDGGTVASYGSFSRPALMAMVGGLAVAALGTAAAIRAAVMRRRPDTGVIATVEDDAVRRSSSHAATGMFAALVSVVGAALALAIGDGLGSLADVACAPGWWSIASSIMLWSLPVWFALFIWAVVAIGNGGRVRARNFEAMK